MKLETIWIVTKPTHDSTLGDICFEATMHSLQLQILGGLKASEIDAVYDDAYEATDHAERLLAEVRHAG